MDLSHPSAELIRSLLSTQPLAVLATVREGQPYTSLVAFTVTENLEAILFPTARRTRKFENLSANPAVSLLVDSRTNRPDDFEDAEAVTAIGRADVLEGAEREALQRLFLARHVRLESFLTSPDCELIRVRVERYIHVSRFKRVIVFEVGSPEGQ